MNNESPVQPADGDITFTDLDDVLAEIDADPRRAAAAAAALVEIECARLDHAHGLQMLRASFGLTQVDLAEKLGISQSNVAQTERRGDLLVSTLRRYIETITGGELRIIITAPNRGSMEFSLNEV